MKRTVTFAMLIALGVSAAYADSDPIAARKALMKSNGAATKTIVGMLKGAPFDLAAVQSALKSYADNAAAAPALFPDSSKTGDTHALPAIWDNKADFEARFKKFGADASAAMANFNGVAGKIQRGEGTLGKLVNDDAFYRDATALVSDLKVGVKDLNAGMKNVNEITAKINRGEGTIGKLVNDDALYTQLRDASKDIGEIAHKVNSGQGTIGRLVNEDQLYRDTTATLKKAERAMEGLGDTGPISVLGSIVGTLF